MKAMIAATAVLAGLVLVSLPAGAGEVKRQPFGSGDSGYRYSDGGTRAYELERRRNNAIQYDRSMGTSHWGRAQEDKYKELKRDMYGSPSGRSGTNRYYGGSRGTAQ